MAKKNKVSGCFTGIVKFFFFGYLAIMIFGALIGGITSLFSDDTENISLADGFTISAYNIILDVKEVIVFGSIIVGSCLGFLIFNLNTARVFMGDTGSLLLRRSNCCNGFIFKDAIDIINNCFNSSSRNIICCITSNLF